MFSPAAGRALAANNPSAEQSSNAAPNSSAGELSTSVVRSEQSSIDSKPAKPDIQSLTGRDGAAVEAALGKPKGQLQTAQGALWLYAEWRGRVGPQKKVRKIER